MIEPKSFYPESTRIPKPTGRQPSRASGRGPRSPGKPGTHLERNGKARPETLIPFCEKMGCSDRASSIKSCSHTLSTAF